MAEIVVDETHLEHQIKIRGQQFDVLLITRATWFHLDGPSEIQGPRLNCNDLHACISSESLIKALMLDRTVTANYSYK